LHILFQTFFEIFQTSNDDIGTNIMAAKCSNPIDRIVCDSKSVISRDMSYSNHLS